MTAPNKEQVKNLGRTTLNGGINNSVTSLVVTSASTFPTAGNFRILIEDEIMLVTAVSGTTFTVVRGYEGTAAASHADTTQIDHPTTAGGLLTYLGDSYAPSNYHSPYAKIVDTDGETVLVASDFTWVNQGTATVADELGSILLTCPPPGQTELRILARSHAATNSYIAAFQMAGAIDVAAEHAVHFGLGFRQSSSGKFTVQMFVLQGFNTAGRASRKLQVRNWDGPGPAAGFTTIRSEEGICVISPAIWMKVEDDNTNLKYYIGIDSENWILIHTVGRTTHMSTTGPDQVIWYGQTSGSDTNSNAYFRLLHFSRV